ncbi:hypothetical protein IFM89_011928 [Coptis chinensis]|uniref:Uncharacterized protein n=1 Tax=Coptis chinensis TaxID=261450 RepID=A0A835LEV0_9MAGN|nr:hypothetical protein IFM89_011928 [Coptis chinensis]
MDMQNVITQESIPVIDMSKWDDPHVMRSICDAAEKWGFFQDDSVVVVWKDEGFDDSLVNTLTLKELRNQVMMVANALDATFSKDSFVAKEIATRLLVSKAKGIFTQCIRHEPTSLRRPSGLHNPKSSVSLKLGSTK